MRPARLLWRSVRPTQRPGMSEDSGGDFTPSAVSAVTSAGDKRAGLNGVCPLETVQFGSLPRYDAGMRRASLVFWAALVLGASISSSVAGDRKSAALVEVGSFHGNEVSARDGDLWTGLFPQSDGSFAWQQVRIATRTSHDDVVDEEGQNTGKTVSVPAGKPLLLVQGLPELLGNKVKPIFSGERELYNGDVIDLRLGQNRYQLRILNPRTSQKQIAAGSELHLLIGSREQQLFAIAEADEPTWTLLGAGDLDGDGKLDLYLNLSSHYNVSRHVLFLSSRAESGKLVREVAAFTTTGC